MSSSRRVVKDFIFIFMEIVFILLWQEAASGRDIGGEQVMSGLLAIILPHTFYWAAGRSAAVSFFPSSGGKSAGVIVSFLRRSDVPSSNCLRRAVSVSFAFT